MCAYELCLYARLLSLGITVMHHRNSSVYINSLNKCMNSAQYISSCMQFNLLYFTPGKGLSMNVFCLYSLINTHMYIILLVFWQTAWFSSEILEKNPDWFDLSTRVWRMGIIHLYPWTFCETQFSGSLKPWK